MKVKKKQKVNDNKDTTYPKDFLKAFKVKSSFFFKLNALLNYKIDLLVFPIL